MNYLEAIKKYLLENSKKVLKEPYKSLELPFIDPGEGYGGNLWDWDSYWMAHAFLYFFKNYDEKAKVQLGVSEEKVLKHIKGYILSFLTRQCDDGFVPTMVMGEGDWESFFVDEHKKGTALNQMKPFLCQAVQEVCEHTNDYDWFNVEQLILFLEYYEKFQIHEETGLFIWENDIMIGVDNNPTVFFRPLRSSADIFLNSFIYMEYVALGKILRAKNDPREAAIVAKGEKLKNAINLYMWDERDGIYYSQDVSFYKTTIKTEHYTFHDNLMPHWKTMPLRIRFWGCFLPLYANIADEAKVERLLKHVTDNAIWSDYGIRSLAADEPMYNLQKTLNPSNWLGAIWVVVNYCIWEGLVRHGCKDIAEKIRENTIHLVGKNLTEKGAMFESYNPETGEENLYPGFLSWNMLMFKMVEEPQE